MSPPHQPTGFFDLPFEIRQQIYTQILPEDRLIRYPLSHSKNALERNAIALCAAHAACYQEMGDWMYKHCDAVLTIIPDKEVDLPEGIEWERFHLIYIEIDYRSTYSVSQDRFGGMSQAIASLLSTQSTQLSHLRTRFREDKNPYRDGVCGLWFGEENPYLFTSWYQKMPEGYPTNEPAIFEPNLGTESRAFFEDSDDESESREVTCMRTGDDREPLVVLVLQYFLQLPPCETAIVNTPDGLDYDGLADQDGPWRSFDEEYASEISAALEYWMEGKREGITLPKGTDKYGRLVLEQLTHMTVGRYENGDSVIPYHWLGELEDLGGYRLETAVADYV